MECAVVLLYVLMKLSSLAYANRQGEPGLNEHTLDKRPLPSNSTLSFSVAPTVPGLINSTTTKGPIKTNSSAVLNKSGSSISQSELRGHSSSGMMTRSTEVPTVRVSRTQSMISPTTIHVNSTSAETSVHLSSSVLPLHPSTSPPPVSGAPDPPVIWDIKVVSAHSVLINWNTTTGQIVSNFSVELSVDFVSWKKAVCNGSVEPGDCVITEKQAVITQLKPYTSYTFRVVARGQFGTSNYSTESKMVLTDEAGPSTPRNLSAQSVSSTEIQVSWKPPANTNGKIKYRLSFYKTLEPSTEPMLVYDGNATQHLVSNLKPYTQYTFEAAAYNVKYHLSSASVNTSEKTDQAAPSGAPLITAARAISSQEILVVWQPPPPETLNGKLQKYEIHVRKTTSIQPTTLPTSKVVATTYTLHSAVSSVIMPSAGSLSSSFTSVPLTPKPTTPDSAYTVTKPLEPTQEPEDQRAVQGHSLWLIDAGLVLNYTVGNLEKWTKYEVKVRSVTVAPGPFSDKVTVRTSEDVPSQPRQLFAKAVNSTAVFVNWTEPAEMNGHLVKYQVKYSAKLSLESVITKDVGQNDSAVLGLLNPFTLYVINVSAFTSKGEGSHARVEILTDEGRPSPPRNLSSQSVNSTKIQVSWKPPANTNGKIKYRLSLYKTLEPSAAPMLVYDGNATQHLVSNLSPYTQYTFEVAAYNVKYNLSSASVDTSEKTDEDEPSSPRNVTAKSVNSTAIKITWVKALHPNGIIYYELYKRLSKEDGQNDQMVYAGMGTSHVAAGLQEYVMYTFTVVSVNSRHKWKSKPVVVMETTHPAEPTGPPQDILAWTLSSTSILVKWSPPLPSEQNGVILNYTVSYISQSSQLKSLNTTDNSSNIEVKNLTIFTKYWFTVKAWNVVGPGPESEPVYNTTFEDTPSPPVNIVAKTVNSTAIKVTWQAPLYPNGDIYYRLYYWQSSEGAGTKRLAFDGPLLEHIVAGLHEYITYTFMLQAYNVKYLWTSEAINATETTHPAEPSGPPLNVKALTRSSTSILVKWSPPSKLDRNGIITHYIVKYSSLNSESSINTTDNATQILVTGLRKYTNYSFTLRAVNEIGVGPPSVEDARNTTSEDVPGEPVIVNVTSKTNSLEVTWEPPTEPNGIITTFRLCWMLSVEQNTTCVSLNGGATGYEIRSLIAFSEYDVSLAAGTSIGRGPFFAGVYKTAEGVPSKPQDLRAWNTSASSIFVTWKEPASINGILKGYQVFSRPADDTDDPALKDAGLRTNFTLSGLEPYKHYDVAVQALTGAGGGEKSKVTVMTDETVPSGPPLNVKIESTTSTSFTLTWDTPLEPNGIIIGYDVKYYECDKPDIKNIYDNVNERKHTIKDLHPYRCYRVYVACESSGGLGAYSDVVENWTKPGVPPPLGTLAPPDEETIESSSFVVYLTEASNDKGDVSYYQVIVRELATDNKDQPVLAQDPEHYKAEDLYTYEEARKMKPQLVPYIAAEFHAKDFSRYQSFVVGDGSRSSKVSEDILSRRRKREENTIKYYNGPLEENTFYAVFQRAYVNKDIYISSSWIEPVETAAAVSPTAPPGSPTNIGLIVGIVLILLIVPIVLAAVYFMWKKRKNSDTVLDDRDEFSNGRPVRMKKMSRKRRSLQKRLMGSTESLGGLEELAASRARRHPVPIDDFERHVDRMHMDGDHGFSEEYLLVQPDEEFSFQQFLNPANKYKNRYANIVAYDHTRVLLNPIDGVPGSDYINANFLDGYNRQRAYIAAQGPLMETFDDFWRMIWEQMSSIIVMLTKLEERGRRKCDQYWPERGTRNYGQVQVTLKETLNMSHYTVRKLVMTHKMYPDDERVVKQFHFTAWPDHGVPSHPTPLLSMVRHTFSANRESIGPMVVHCSAGVGRTGTFITLDVMLQRISQEDSVDVFGFVRQMRYQRNFMVQTEAQYVFIHDALLEAITCGVTEVEAKDLGARIRELRQVDSETGYTYLENEFCRLAKEENHPIAFKSASLNCNTSKNRYANILPFESTRVHLKMRPGEMGSDYINANFIDGYCQPRAYIATQAPVPDTFEDFWRMVWEQESAAVVMLTREEEAGKVKCHHYWPSEGSRLYGVILVELVEEASFGDYISRKFKLTHTEEKDSRTICQFQYTDWPDTGLPDSGVGIVDLIGQVQKWQQQSGNTAIVLHCSGGVGRTGVFCGISMMIERLKAEGVIDVFQTVQAMRLQRPAMVQTAEQYEFCYTTLQEYLDSFDLYANFQ